jgi:hypothetical protein
VYWTPEAIRGKKPLPPTLRYVGLSRFPEDVVGVDDLWSVELRFGEPPPEQSSIDFSRATVRFLVADAPHQRLHEGAKFGLYEGPYHVADVEVVSEEEAR